jgi:hypothetical protein
LKREWILINLDYLGIEFDFSLGEIERRFEFIEWLVESTRFPHADTQSNWLKKFAEGLLRRDEIKFCPFSSGESEGRT